MTLSLVYARKQPPRVYPQPWHRVTPNLLAEVKSILTYQSVRVRQKHRKTLAPQTHSQRGPCPVRHCPWESQYTLHWNTARTDTVRHLQKKKEEVMASQEPGWCLRSFPSAISSSLLPSRKAENKYARRNPVCLRPTLKQPNGIARARFLAPQLLTVSHLQLTWVWFPALKRQLTSGIPVPEHLTLSSGLQSTKYAHGTQTYMQVIHIK